MGKPKPKSGLCLWVLGPWLGSSVLFVGDDHGGGHLKTSSTSTGFEPARAKPKRFRISLLNHSDTMSCERSQT